MIVECRVHGGQMRFDRIMDEWYCVGFDGEGCRVKASRELISNLLSGHSIPRLLTIDKITVDEHTIYASQEFV